MILGLIDDPIFQEHDPGRFHCESPSRLLAIHQELLGWPGLSGCQRLPLRLASEEEILRVHQPAHLHRIALTKGKCLALDADTGTSPRSFDVAMVAAGSLVDMCDRALAGDIYQGVSLIRPPGHHATGNRAMGFCLFNNVAVAAAHLLQARDLERVLIVDWDVHHGNGTEDIFFQSDQVLYFSTHQWPLYPGTGPCQTVGRGTGSGYTVNVPLAAGQGDLDYIRVFEDLLVPVARAYKPQFILISAGFDPHQEDPLGGMQVTDAGFAALAQICRDLAAELCPGRLVLTLEGGYAVEAQARAMREVMEVLVGGDQNELRARAQGHPQPKGLVQALEVAGEHWSLN
ncbi:MAG: histone deacetylase [Deltaproteobacteria bacterium]|nr:histone deacetylase [Deltaproteobacteria bacterium]